MFERFDHYQSLDPLQTLRLLTQFAERNPEFLRLLRLIELKADATPFGTRLDLRIRRGRGRWHAQAREEFQALFAAEPGTARFVEKVRINSGAYQPVATIIPNLLRADSAPKDGAEHGYLSDQKLLLARDPGIERGRAIYEALRLHATQVRMAMVQGRDSVLYVYHVLDDAKRQSAFQGALAGELFADCSLLQLYASDIMRGDDAYLLSLSSDIQPTRELIALFVRLLLAAPALFGVQTETLPRILLAVITANELVYMGQSRFYNAWEMGRVLPFKSYQVLRAKENRDQMAALQRQIAAAAPNAGYRLQLRSASVNVEDQASVRKEYELLKRQMAILQDRLVELEALRVPRPRLLRFDAEQLPALVSVLRRYRPQDLQHLRYSFQATEDHPMGVHYLYIDPKANAYGLDPTVWHDLQAAKPIAFWLEPSWAAHYNRAPNRIALFVPQGKRLYPAMHSWQPDQMDSYLRTMMQNFSLPNKPIFIMGPGPDPSIDIHLSVLDDSALLPLNAPQVVGWINDNLTILRNLPEVQKDLQSLARVHARRELYEAAVQNTELVKHQFEARSRQLEQDYTQFVGELLQTLDEEYQRVNGDAKKAVAHIRKLDRHLAQLVNVHDETQNQVNQAEKLLDDSRKALQSLGKAAHDVEEQVRKTLREANLTRDRLDSQLRTRVDELQQRRQELENKIAELERLL